MHATKFPLWGIGLAVALLIGGAAALFSGTGSTEHPQEEAHEHENEHDHDHGHAEKAHSDATTIREEAAKRMGIETVIAGPATIRETVRLSGRVVLNQNRSAAVKARFPGVVRGVFKQVGDHVKRGEKLATVESNESLQVYAVPAPLEGVVLERTISVGDTASDDPIFMVADLNSLWTEFFIFAADMERVRQGQPMIIRSLDGKLSATSTLQTIQPTAEASSQTIVARAELENHDGVWRSGMTVQGHVVIHEAQVKIAVPNDALQQMEGETVVFVKSGMRYEATPVTLGRADMERTQILEGLTAGTEIVSKGSFVIKADIGKAGAAHEH